jgi:S-adenosylmethionine:tRNA ribosyltransferase-isomerase
MVQTVLQDQNRVAKFMRPIAARVQFCCGALEAAATEDGHLRGSDGVATGRIGPATRLRVVNAILSGTHERGTSHYELLRAFLEDSTLERATKELDARGYRTHEFGDSVLIL